MRRLLILAGLWAATGARAAEVCAPDPYGGRALYLRGSFNAWNAVDAQRFTWVCDRYEAVVQFEGEHSFKVGDESWTVDADFGRGSADGALARQGGNLTQRFAGTQRAVLQVDASRLNPTLRFEACPAAAPLGANKLYLRGSMTSWAPLEDYAFQYRCDAYYLNVNLTARQEFKIADADWTPATSFGAGPDGAFMQGGGNLQHAFTGEHTLRVSFDGGKPQLNIGPKSFPDASAKAVTDPVALSLRFDSRALADKAPFGALPMGTTVAFNLSALPGVTALTLVVERRRLEGNQDLLEYTELARVPMTKQRAGNAERWSGSHRFADKAVYGYWFEAQVADKTFVYQNNNDAIFWTRERGSGGVGAVALQPESLKAVRRFRQTVFDPAFKVPDWAADVVFYQIFPDRFRNGDRRNDPRPGIDHYQDHSVELHQNWLDQPWKPGTGDGSDKHFNNDFFGGDLAGITQKLGYLKDLGVNTLYLTPIFKAPSNHKYDTADYKKVDRAFGTDAEFTRLTREAARRGMRVIPDTSFNHTGSDSTYFDRYGNFKTGGAFEGGQVRPDSPYASWYRFDTTQADPGKQYKGWGGPDLPEIDKSSPAFRRFAYGAPDSVTRLWLDRGAAGWRMDVAPWVLDDFWREWRQAVKQHRPDALTVAETWFDASKYFLGDTFDSTMNYIFRNAVLEYAAGGRAQDLVSHLEHLREAYPPQALYALMNLVSSHDVGRALHHLGWQKEGDDTATVARAKQRLRLATFIQMTSPGAPMVYYGDEVGVAGGDDPYNRATYPWADLGGRPDRALLADFKALIQMRHRHAVLRRGSTDAPLFADEHVVVQARRLGNTWALVATNNAAEPRTVKLRLPAEMGKVRWHNVLGGPGLGLSDGIAELLVPPVYGSVLIGR